MLFYSFTFAINLWHRKFVTTDVTACSVCDDGKILIKSLYLNEYTANRLTDEFPEKSWIKHGVNKLLKKLRDTGTVERRPGSGRPRSAVPKKTLSFFFRSSRSLPLTLFCRSAIVGRSNREHPFARKENEVPDTLRELLKQKLSMLHASNTVRVCQLLCTTPLETFQMQAFT